MAHSKIVLLPKRSKLGLNLIEGQTRAKGMTIAVSQRVMGSQITDLGGFEIELVTLLS